MLSADIDDYIYVAPFNEYDGCGHTISTLSLIKLSLRPPNRIIIGIIWLAVQL